MKILVLGDIVGEPGRKMIAARVPRLREEEEIDFVVANGENIAGGSGLTFQTSRELLGSGVDCLMTGDHVWDKKEIVEAIEQEKRILRPVNYPDGVPGRGAVVLETRSGRPVGVINTIGRVFMRDAFDCPFRTTEKAAAQLRKQTPFILVDIHAEATSEKVALGWYLDGKVSAVFGTHTHIQTSDEKILPKGTAYITDLGMTGAYHSVLGREIQRVVDRFLTQMPQRFELATDDVQLHGAVIELDDTTGLALSIRRI
ncbi:MAG: TIGR00282 family metallophosphoesterase [Candidatus Omnitrophota bacterium]